MRLLGSPARVHERYSGWFALRDRKICIPHSSKESATLLLEAIFIALRFAILRRVRAITPAGAIHTGGDVGIHQDGDFWLQTTAQNSMQCQHSFAAEFASAALVRLSRIGKAIAEYDLTLGKCRLDDFSDVLCSRGEHQGHFGEWRKRGSFCIQQKLANFFAGRRAARFPGQHDGQSLSPQNRS